MFKFTFFYLLIFPLSLFAQSGLPSTLKAVGAPNDPAVEVSWNRYHDYAGMTDILNELNNAYQNLSSLESIGKSYEGKDLWCITITNFESGKPEDKPAYYIDASIHANEAQAVEVALYTAWFLLETYDEIDFTKQLLNRVTFYIIPMQSPDSRDKFFYEPNTAHSPRSGQIPRDDDGDGLMDEDGYDDLNNDGFITQMRIKSKYGRWKTDPDDSRIMVRCKPDEIGSYDLIWSEGIDNDGDGIINEDGDGYYDPNRNWGRLWRPHYIQYGADRYPFSLPETKAIENFLSKHPNILGSQSYHNTGGMILIGPYQNEADFRFEDDLQLIDFIGKKGLELLPGYKYINSYKDFYPTYGDETNWHYAGHGIMSFVNELWTQYNMFREDPENSTETIYKFDKYLLFGDAFVDWEEVEHPKYGKVEVGGIKKTFGRMPPSFLLEEECHRNMAFTLMHADMLPQLSIENEKIDELDGGLYKITVDIINKRLMPTKLSVDKEYKITRPDWIEISGAEVISGGIKKSEYDKDFSAQEYKPEKLMIERIDGNSKVTASWLVSGSGSYTIKVNSIKGGKIEKVIKPKNTN